MKVMYSIAVFQICYALTAPVANRAITMRRESLPSEDPLYIQSKYDKVDVRPTLDIRQADGSNEHKFSSPYADYVAAADPHVVLGEK